MAFTFGEIKNYLARDMRLSVRMLKGGDKKKDEPLVRLQSFLSPGFKTLALMPYISMDNIYKR